MNQRVVQPAYHHQYLSNLAVVPFLTWWGVVRFPSVANYGCLCLLTSRLNKDVQLTKLYTAAQIWQPRTTRAVTRCSHLVARAIHFFREFHRKSLYWRYTLDDIRP